MSRVAPPSPGVAAAAHLPTRGRFVALMIQNAQGERHAFRMRSDDPWSKLVKVPTRFTCPPGWLLPLPSEVCWC